MRQLLNITLLFGFFLLCSSASICHLYKLSADEISAIANNIVEEEDETEKDTKGHLDEFIEMDRLESPDLVLQKNINSISSDLFIELIVNKISTPPPKQATV
jgi:hypothetical protein